MRNIHSLRCAPRLRNRRRINDADQPLATRCRRGLRQRLPDQQGQPVAAIPQPLQQRHIGDVDEANRGRPRRRQSQAFPPQTIREDQTQQIDGGLDLAPAQKRLCLARAGLKRRRPAKPSNDAVPILADK
jgi:hypothetical protein